MALVHIAKRAAVRVIGTVALLGLLMGLIVINWSATSSTPNAVYAEKKLIQYSFTLRNTSNQVREDVEFWVYAPVSQNSFQKSDQIDANVPFTKLIDGQGNQVLKFFINHLAPFSNQQIRIRVPLVVATNAQSVAVQDLTQYLKAERYIELEHDLIQQHAAQLHTKQPNQEQAHKIFDWIIQNIQATNYQRLAHGAVEVLKKRQGDCTEFAYLFAALARKNAIPARVLGGYRYPTDAILKSEDYHNWVEIYLEGAWRVVDPHGKRFLTAENEYVAMSVLNETEHHPLASHTRFYSSDPNVSVRMN